MRAGRRPKRSFRDLKHTRPGPQPDTAGARPKRSFRDLKLEAVCKHGERFPSQTFLPGFETRALREGPRDPRGVPNVPSGI